MRSDTDLARADAQDAVTCHAIKRDNETMSHTIITAAWRFFTACYDITQEVIFMARDGKINAQMERFCQNISRTRTTRPRRRLLQAIRMRPCLRRATWTTQRC